MLKWLKRIFVLTLILFLLAAVALGCRFIYWYANGCIIAYQTSVPTMSTEGEFEIHYSEYQGQGTIRFTWTEGLGGNCDGYLLQILEPAESSYNGEERLIWSTRLQDEEFTLPFVPWEKELIIRIRTYNDYVFPLQQYRRTRVSTDCLQMQGSFPMPRVENLTWEADPNADTVRVTFDMDKYTTARLYYKNTDGSLTQIGTLSSGDMTLFFGENGQFPVPDLEGSHSFVVDAYTRKDGYTYYGLITDGFSIVREDLLGTELLLNCVDEGTNDFTLTWNETKGERYEVQQYDEENKAWVTVHTVGRDEERTYYTGHLPRYSQFRYRVVALGGQTLPGTIFAAVPAEVQVETGASVVYSTIWPIQDLNVYSDPTKTEIIGTVYGADAFCVLDVEEDLFYVRTDDGYGYIDSRYCMINLPEMIGDLCWYNITNSYASLYMAHEFEIPEVTNTVIKGYEDIQIDEDEYLVPLLYPVAQRLEKAAFAAREEGYVLKIYDSFRPRKATVDLYEKASKLEDSPIPDYTFVYPKNPVTGEKAPRPEKDPVTGEDLPLGTIWHEFLEIEMPEPPPTEPTDPNAPTEPPEPTDPNAPTEPVDDGRPTYSELMTDYDRYPLYYFLANGTSRHNQGIAMDLTIADLETGKDVEMQTSIHDLTWYSELENNNKEAKLLAKIMEGAGFTGLISEWWHFQDNDVWYDLEPEHLWYGVSAECWMADDHGWRYRRYNGYCFADCSREIDGVVYTFDEEGYVIDPIEETEDPEPTQGE